MHILIIPSEQFVPDSNKLEGIFQYHQATILKEAGYKVGALSVRLSLSLPMLMKSLLLKAAGRKTGNETDSYTAADLVRTGIAKLFKPQQFVTRQQLEGITVYRVDGLYMRPPGNNKNAVSWVRAGLVCFDEYCKEQGRPDLIHAHDAIYAGLLAAKIHASRGVKYIITEHSSTYALKTTDANILDQVKNAHAGAIGLYAVSESFAGLLNQLFSFNRFQYLPNVLDQYLENSRSSYHPIVSGKFIFLNIAVLKPVKDQATLLAAFHQVLQQTSEVELWIGGNGELESVLKKQAQTLGIIHAVKFLGLLSREEVIQRIQQCNCFVLSSKYETFGVVVIEAMLFGKPVIVTRCGVGQTIVTKEVGHVVEVGSVPQLSAAMMAMLQTKEAYDGELLRKQVIENFGKHKFLNRMNNIYKEAVS